MWLEVKTRLKRGWKLKQLRRGWNVVES